MGDGTCVGRILPGDTITLEKLHAMFPGIMRLEGGELKATRAIALRVITTPPPAPKPRTVRRYTDDDFR